MTVFTIGHSTRSLEEFVALLKEAGADFLADVRRFPRSRRQPQFNIDTLPQELAKYGIGYRHMEALGGRRNAPKGRNSPHTLWRVEAFRNYADYAETPEFQAAFRELLQLAKDRQPAIMCAEAVWWQCHRRIITDYLLAAGIEVRHIMGPGKIEPARLTEGAAPRPDGTVLYRDASLLL